MSTEVHHVSVRSVRTYNRQPVEVPFVPSTFRANRRRFGNYPGPLLFSSEMGGYLAV